MIVFGRKVQLGKAVVAKLARQLGVATNQVDGSEAMNLRLQDLTVVDVTKLAKRAVHRADEVGLGRGSDACLERAAPTGSRR